MLRWMNGQFADWSKLLMLKVSSMVAFIACPRKGVIKRSPIFEMCKEDRGGGEEKRRLTSLQNFFPPIVIARLPIVVEGMLDRAIQKKALDSPVKPENDREESTLFYY